MKVILLGDVHIGARNDSQIFCNYHISFFENQLFPYIEQHGIKKIIQFGDVFDRRKFVNFQILNEWKRRVFDWLLERDIEVDIIAGNHDVYFKNTNDVNSPVLLLREYHNINPYIVATDSYVGETQVLYVPWINDSNYKQTMEMVKKTKSTIAFGHFEFNGFEIDKGHKFEGGIDAAKFKKFDTILSGHFHHRSDNGTIFYLGVPYQITWVDYGSKKGFHVWDTSTLDLEFIPNDDEIFIKYLYDDDGSEDYWKGFDCSNVTNKYVKVVVVNKKDLYGFDQFLSKIYSNTPAEVKIIENMADFDAENVQEEDLKLEDTSVMLDNYIEAIDTNLDKDRLKKIMKHLYTEALHVEEV